VRWPDPDGEVLSGSSDIIMMFLTDTTCRPWCQLYSYTLSQKCDHTFQHAVVMSAYHILNRRLGGLLSPAVAAAVDGRFGSSFASVTARSDPKLPELSCECSIAELTSSCHTPGHTDLAVNSYPDIHYLLVTCLDICAWSVLSGRIFPTRQSLLHPYRCTISLLTVSRLLSLLIPGAAFISLSQILNYLCLLLSQ